MFDICAIAQATATAAVQNECGEMPLHLRWLGDSVKESVKDHASEEVIRDQWTLHVDQFQEGQELLFQRAMEFFHMKFQECKGINSVKEATALEERT